MENPRTLAENAFCSLNARDSGEPLAGTAAAQTDLWFALEYDGMWPAKPLIGGALPAALTALLSQWLERAPTSRFQFIRQKETRDGRVRFFVAQASPGEEWRVRFDLTRAEELLDLGLTRLLDAQHHEAAAQEDGPIALVCCHGKRDRCCAKYGRAFYDALHEVAGNRAWQTSHLGGHRFAPTLVMLPEGICYGQLNPEEAAGLWSAHERGEFYSLDRVRGRSAYDAPTQAAEIFLRQARGPLGLAPLGSTVSMISEELGRTICFSGAGGGEHRVTMTHTELGCRIKSCGDAPASTHAWRPRAQRNA